MFDYMTLKFLWWVLVGVLLIGFTIMDGHDMGVGTLIPFVGKGDTERRVIINTIGPHWDGNQVWFITAGAGLFAAWPIVYATAFSGFYFAMMAVLWALFFRPVGFEYRSKIQNPTWRTFWDWGLFVGGTVPPIIFGVAFGNLLQGVPFQFDDTMRVTYHGTFWALLNPFALLCGLVSSAMIICHGANYLLIRTTEEVYERARIAARVFGIVAVVLFILGGIWLQSIPGYTITSALDPNAYPNPLDKTVALLPGAWMANYAKYPVTVIFPILGIVGMLASVLAAQRRAGVLAFIASSLGTAGIILTAGISMFPFVMPSSMGSLNSGLTLWDCTSSESTLNFMFWVVLIFTPIIILYTSWAYRVMRGKVTKESIEDNNHTAY